MNFIERKKISERYKSWKEDHSLYFWSTHAGAELDLFWQGGGKNRGIEFKYIDAPRITKSMSMAVNDLQHCRNAAEPHYE